jgi:hypothetical protein
MHHGFVLCVAYNNLIYSESAYTLSMAMTTPTRPEMTVFGLCHVDPLVEA